MYQMIFRFPAEWKKILKAEADKKGQTLTGLIKQILWDWIENKREG